MHTELVECRNDIQPSKMFVSQDPPDCLLDQRQGVTVPFSHGVELPAVDTEAEVAVSLEIKQY